MLKWLCAFAMLLLGAGMAFGHPMPNSIVSLDVGETTISGEIVIPLIELDLALGTDLSGAPEANTLTAQDDLIDYLSNHIAVTAPDGRPWDVAIGPVTVMSEHGDIPYAEIIAAVKMTPPNDAPLRDFLLTYDAVMHKVVTHYAVINVRTDWFNGEVGHDAEVSSIGIIRMNPVDGSVAPLTVSLSAGSYWQGFVAMLGLGASHIAEGTDHLLFLLTLLLPAPMVAVGQRWNRAAGTRRTLVSMLAIVTAFTIGHSVSLVLAGLSRLELPQQPIEVIIALTILVSAIHALRPLFPRREPLIAGLFGLVHGMAFSFTLADLNLSTSQLLLSLLGFNLGIELFQLLIVALALPALWLFAHSGAYAPVRIGGAVLAILASLIWLADRLGWSSEMVDTVDSAGHFLPWAMLALTGAAIATWCVRRLWTQKGASV